MAGGGSSTSNAPMPRQRVEAETKPETSNTNTLLRAKNGSAFARCEGCNKNVAVALISMHNCSLDAKIRVNLEAQVVETQTEAKKRPIVERKKSTTDDPKPKRLRKAKDGKKSSTSNKPKRPLTAFFLFMNDFRKTYKEENLFRKNLKDYPKHGAEKWKSLTEEEKKFYLDKAAELKAEYNKSLENYANEEEEDEEKQSDADADADADEKEVVDAEEKEVVDAEEKEVDMRKKLRTKKLDVKKKRKKRFWMTTRSAKLSLGLLSLKWI